MYKRQGWTAAGKVTGYDTTPEIAKETESACKLHARSYGNVRCGEATLVMLRASDKSCEGEIYFELDGNTKKIL